MIRHWVSWEQTTDDYRPLTDPPTEAVLGWWCSGSTADGDATICAVVLGKDEEDVLKNVRSNWEAKDGEVGEIRFCEPKPNDWTPSNRFPISEPWERERFGDSLEQEAK